MFQIQYKRTCRVGQIIRWCMTQHIAINTTSGLFPASPLKSSETEIILRASISSLVIFVFKERGSCHCTRVHEKFYLFFLVVVIVVVEVGETVLRLKQLRLGLRLIVRT